MSDTKFGSAKKLATTAMAVGALSALGAAPVRAADVVPRPPAMAMTSVPQVPVALAEATRPYLEYRTARARGWNAADRSMLVTTRFGNTLQLHRVAAAGAARTQLSFESEPVDGHWSPDGRTLLAIRDSGGDEFYQLYALADGRMTLLTDGKSVNEFGAFSRDGTMVGYSSTRRNGRDTDLYVLDPRRPGSERMVAQRDSAGWNIAAFAPDGQSAVVLRGRSIAHSELWRLDLASGALTPIGDPRRTVAIASPRFDSAGRLWALSDEGSDVTRLGSVDLASGRFTPRSPASGHDVEAFALSPDGRSAAFLANVDGRSRLSFLDLATGAVREVRSLPAGVASDLDFAPWGTLGLTLASAQIPGDVFAVDPASLAVTRWTMSETGGLDPARNVEPEVVRVKSFDGEAVSGLLYRPDPAKFPGKRPLVMWIHGGPESQARPDFRGRYNYLLNEMGIALFYPNVRGSSGFGKRFLSLDNGPFRREDAVKDIGAFLAALKADAGIDPERIAQTGRSYGGYMCYASAIHYPTDFKSANCVVAISDFVTFLQNTMAYRRDLRRVEYGDERDPKQLAQFAKIAPMRRIGEIKVPLYIVAGENDPRVPASEARQAAQAVSGRGTPVWLSIAMNEGHQWGKKENVDYQFWTDLMFWEQTLRR